MCKDTYDKIYKLHNGLYTPNRQSNKDRWYMIPIKKLNKLEYQWIYNPNTQQPTNFNHCHQCHILQQCQIHTYQCIINTEISPCIVANFPSTHVVLVYEQSIEKHTFFIYHYYHSTSLLHILHTTIPNPHNQIRPLISNVVICNDHVSWSLN